MDHSLTVRIMDTIESNPAQALAQPTSQENDAIAAKSLEKAENTALKKNLEPVKKISRERLKRAIAGGCSTRGEAGELIAGLWLENHVIIAGKWYERDEKTGRYVAVPPVVLGQHMGRIVRSLALQYRDKSGHLLPWPDRPADLADLVASTINAAENTGRAYSDALNGGLVYFSGEACEGAYLVEGGDVITVDHRTKRVSLESRAGAVATHVHLKVAPSLTSAGELRPFAALAEDHPARRLIAAFAGGDGLKERRLWAQCGRLIFRRASFDADTSQSLVYWYGPKGAGKTTLVQLIREAMGGRLADFGQALSSSLDAKNRFGGASLFCNTACLVDDVELTPKHQDALLSLCNTTHLIERKGIDAAVVESQPSFVFLSNYAPPTLHNATALARRFCPVQFEAPKIPTWPLIDQIRKDSELLGDFIAGAGAAYFDALAYGYGETVDDSDMYAQAEIADPFADWAARFLESDTAGLTEKRLISAYRGKIDPAMAPKTARAGILKAIKERFGNAAVRYDANRHAVCAVRFTADWAAAIKWAGEHDASPLDWIDESREAIINWASLPAGTGDAAPMGDGEGDAEGTEGAAMMEGTGVAEGTEGRGTEKAGEIAALGERLAAIEGALVAAYDAGDDGEAGRLEAEKGEIQAALKAAGIGEDVARAIADTDPRIKGAYLEGLAPLSELIEAGRFTPIRYPMPYTARNAIDLLHQIRARFSTEGVRLPFADRHKVFAAIEAAICSLEAME